MGRGLHSTQDAAKARNIHRLNRARFSRRKACCPRPFSNSRFNSRSRPRSFSKTVTLSPGCQIIQSPHFRIAAILSQLNKTEGGIAPSRRK